jgi:hypothetical protein
MSSSRTRQWMALVAANLLAAGCAPYVTHSPALQPGSTFAVTLGYTALTQSCYEQYMHDTYGNITSRTQTYCPEGDDGPTPLLISTARTWKADSLGSGIRLGLDMPPWPGWEALLFTQAGAFWQAPKSRPGALDWGAGAIVSAVWIAPYVQVGRIKPDGRGWYTTQMLGHAHSLLGADEDFGTGWHPTVAYQMPCQRCSRADDAEVLLRLFVSAGIERSPIIDARFTDARHVWTRIISAGVTVDGRHLLASFW